jgi:hypothetical protein
MHCALAISCLIPFNGKIRRWWRVALSGKDFNIILTRSPSPFEENAHATYSMFENAHGVFRTSKTKHVNGSPPLPTPSCGKLKVR